MVYYFLYMSIQLKKAFITGITGQDGSYLAEFLLQEGYKIFGLVRSMEGDSLENIEKLYKDRKITLFKGDLGIPKSIKKALEIAQPDEIYNLAAQANDINSFKLSEETQNINYRGVGYLVNKAMELNPRIKIFQAGSSLMFDKTVKPPQNEKTPFSPASPYGKFKLKAHNEYVIGYRKKHTLFICSGIFFNHESPRRKENFVTRKITKSLVKIKLGLADNLKLGNLEMKKDWGYAPEYIEATWKMLQQKTPKDFVIATGETHSVREFVNETCKVLNIKIIWKGKGINEKGIDIKTGKTIIEIDKKYFRPNEVNYLRGDNTKAEKILKWKPKCNFKKLVKIMVKADMEKEMKDAHL